MNTFLKILLYIFSVFIILNFILFLFLLSISHKKSINDRINNSLDVIYMGYSFIYFAIHQLIYGKKTYQPVASSEYQ